NGFDFLGIDVFLQLMNAVRIEVALAVLAGVDQGQAGLGQELVPAFPFLFLVLQSYQGGLADPVVGVVELQPADQQGEAITAQAHATILWVRQSTLRTGADGNSRSE